MCGITGTYSFKHDAPDIRYTQWCLQTMQHRGPDAAATWHNGENYIAGFVRLAIRDVSSRGNQPMLTEDEQYCLSFNGEIYNTDALKQKLQPYKNAYRSTTDTEVLLYSLVFLGIEKTLQLADGIFAFAFFDVKQNKLLLARDRVGTKPLYIGTTARGVVYSSQYDHIINHPFIKNEALDGQVVATYLQLGYMPEGAGIVNNTMLLAHGHYAVAENNRLSINEYFAFPAGNHNNDGCLEKIIAGSVAGQLVSDVPAGTFMSGGIDSSLVSYFANQSAQVQSFTIGLEDAHLDESFAAAQFAKNNKLQHYTRYFSENDLLLLLKQNTAAFTEPFADPSSLPTLLLSQFAKQKITVALSGDGGDELFWGYPRNGKVLKQLHLYQKSWFARRCSLMTSKLSQPTTTDLSRHWNEANFVSYAYSNMFVQGAHRWCSKVCAATPATPFFLSRASALWNTEMSDIEYMNLLRKMEIDLHLQRILLKVDRASMYHSLEVRVPLLSNDMLQLAAGFDYRTCMDSRQGKLPLRQVLSTATSTPLCTQPKKGFTVPMSAWIRTTLKKEMEATILEMPASLAIFFNRKQLQQMLLAHNTLQQDAGWFIWALYSLVKWHQTHVSKAPAGV